MNVRRERGWETNGPLCRLPVLLDRPSRGYLYDRRTEGEGRRTDPQPVNDFQFPSVGINTVREVIHIWTVLVPL